MKQSRYMVLVFPEDKQSTLASSFQSTVKSLEYSVRAYSLTSWKRRSGSVCSTSTPVLFWLEEERHRLEVLKSIAGNDTRPFGIILGNDAIELDMRELSGFVNVIRWPCGTSELLSALEGVVCDRRHSIIGDQTFPIGIVYPESLDINKGTSPPKSGRPLPPISASSRLHSQSGAHPGPRAHHGGDWYR